MRLRALALSPLLLLAALTAEAHAQNVWIARVTPGPGIDFNDLQEAVDAAQEGDVILLRGAADFAPIVIDGKSLTIQRDTGSATIGWNVDEPFHAPVVRVSNLAAGQEVFLRDLDIGGSYFHIIAQSDANVVVTNCAGSVWLEDCRLGDYGGFFGNDLGLRLVDAAGVTLVRSTIFAEVSSGFPFSSGIIGNGIDATDSNLALFDCDVSGGVGANVTEAPGGHALHVRGGTLFASGCTFQGGNGRGGSTALNGGPGGDGLRLEAGAVARVRDCQFTAGSGGTASSPSSPGADGLPTNVSGATLQTVPGTSRSLVEASPLRAGVDTIDETFAGEPGDIVYRLYSVDGQIPPIYLAIVKGSLVIGPSLDGDVMGVIDGTGTLTVQTPFPALPVGVQTVQVTTQASFLAAGGGGFFFSAPSLITLVDPSF